MKSLVPAGSEVVHVRSERAFLRELSSATHAIVWNFKPEWFAAAKRLRVLATPAAGREFVPERGPDSVKIHFGHFHGPIIAESVAAFVLAWARGFFAVERHDGVGVPPLNDFEFVLVASVGIFARTQFPETAVRNRLLDLIRRPELLLALCERV